MRHWWRTLRPAARIARRDAVRSRGRTALVAAMIGLPVLVGVGGAVLVQSSMESPEHAARATLGGAQAVVDDYGRGPITQDALGQDVDAGSAEGASPPAADQGRTIAGVVDGPVVRIDQRIVVLGTHGRELRHVTVVRTQSLPAPSLIASHEVDGALPVADGELLLSAGVADELGVEVGDPVTVRGEAGPAQTVRVVGIGASGSVAVGRLPGATMATTWAITGSAPVTWSQVQALNEHGLRVVSRAVLDHPPYALSIPAPHINAAAVGLFGAAGVMGLLEAVLIVGPAFAVGARRVERQLALVAACGGDPATLGRVVVLTGVIIGVVASCVAAAVGLAVAGGVRAVAVERGSDAFPELRVPWLVVVACVAVGVLVATAASWLPARRAARTDVVAVLGRRRAEVRARRGISALGVGLASVGLAAAIVGAATTTPALLVSGVVAIQVGIVTTSGGLVALVGRLGPRLGVAGRIAVRDAARQRGRTAPAVAAVVAAVAGIVAGGVYLQSSGTAERDSYRPTGAVGTVVAAAGDPVDVFGNQVPDARRPSMSTVDRSLRGALPISQAAVLRAGVPSDDGVGGSVIVAPRPGVGCPTVPEMLAGVLDAASIERCRPQGSDTYSPTELMAPGYQFVPTTLVDDGTAAAVLEGDDAALGRAVATGTVLVNDRDVIWPDGTAHVSTVARGADGVDTVVAELVAPARLVPGMGQFTLLVGDAGAKALRLTAVPVGVVASTTRMPTDGELSEALWPGADSGSIAVEHGFQGSTSTPLLVLVGAAVLVGLGATALAMALSASEFRADLATLAAIGAGPRTRRRVAAAQAGVVVVVGVGLGALTGLLLGAVLVLALHQTGSRLVPMLHLVVPWPTIAAIVVGVPALAMGGAYVLTRSRLPMARRVMG